MTDPLVVARTVLAKIAVFDQTLVRPDSTTVLAWAEAIGDLDLGAALDAVTAHYKTEIRRIMPADIRQRVKSHSKMLPYYRPMREVIANLKEIDERHGIAWRDND